jgi:hypothetical protein
MVKEPIKKMSENNLVGQEGKVGINPIQKIFTLENAIKLYKKFSKNDPYKCTWVQGFENELLQFVYKSGDELVVERLHIDDLEDAGDWDHVGYQHGTEMMFSLNDLKDLTDFIQGKNKEEIEKQEGRVSRSVFESD